MRKLTLSLESLEITSFETDAAAREARGTVLGQARTDECTSPVSPCLATGPVGCVPITGPCTGPECDITLMLTCAGCESLDLVVCP